MRFAKLTCITAVALFTLVKVPVRIAAQGQEEGKEHHRYKLVDIGTFGGPASFTAANSLNSRGLNVGAAATPIPTLPNSNFSVCGGLNGSLLFVQHAFEWQKGEVSDLGAFSPADDNCSFPASINANGEIVGASENGEIDGLTGIKESRAVLWKDGKITDLGTFGGNQSTALSINNRGQVIGAALNAIPDPFSLYDLGYLGGDGQGQGSSNGTQTRAFLWQDGKMQDLGTLGGNDAFPCFVNERGQVSGNSYTNSTPNPTTGFPTIGPFLWDRSRMINLGSFGGTQGFACGLNNRGQVIGTSNLAGDRISHPFLWDDGNLIDLFTQTIGGNPISANALNDAGEIVGGGAFPSRLFDAYLWRNGAASDLGTLDGDCYSEALGINSVGQVVGYSLTCDFSNQRSFLWENGSIIDLNTRIPPNSALQLVIALAINDRGEIAGVGVPPGVPPANLASQGHAFVLIPCDKDHVDNEGCQDNPEGTTAVTQNHSAPVNQSPATVTQGSPTAREIVARIHALMGRRFHVPGLPAGPSN